MLKFWIYQIFELFSLFLGKIHGIGSRVDAKIRNVIGDLLGKRLEWERKNNNNRKKTTHKKTTQHTYYNN